MIGIDMAQQFSIGGCTTTNCDSITMNDASYIYYSSADGKIIPHSSSITFKAPIQKISFDVFEDEDTWWLIYSSSYGYLTDEEHIEVTDFVDDPDLMSAFDWLKIYYAVEIVNNPHMIVDKQQEFEVYVTIDGREVLSELVKWGDIIDAYNGKHISEDQESGEEDSCRQNDEGSEAE